MSPLITNMPPAELEGFAGIYVRNEGYDLFRTNGHCLSWVVGAEDSSASVTNLWPRENGWFSPRDSQNVELCFTNLAGKEVVLVRYLWPDGSFIWQSIRGERHESTTPLPPAWSNRLDKVWPVVDSFAPENYQYLLSEFMGEPTGLKLSYRHDLMVIEDFVGQVQE